MIWTKKRSIWWLAVALLGIAAPALAQTTVATAAKDLAGDWQVKMHGAQGDVRTVMRVSKTPGGVYRALVYSIDQKPTPISVPLISVQGESVNFDATYLNGKFIGKLSPDGNTISGNWTQSGPPMGPNGPQGTASQLLAFERASKTTAWGVPGDGMPPSMDPKADPSFDVTSVKPHNPDTPGDGYRWRDARRFSATLPISWLIRYVYGIQSKQLIGGPEWINTELYDMAGNPDTPGLPSEQQRIIMMRKMLEQRFQLKVHIEKKALPAYVLTVNKGGAKMTPSVIRDPGASLFGKPAPGGGILMPARNTAMSDFIRLLQNMLDRPVIDQTGLQGQFDFDLSFTPEQRMQINGQAVEPAPDAPPGIFTALQEQLGLKLTPATDPVDVVVIDKVEKPSAN